ncbi:unnamed protein product [Notodromas monacha]|uniref:Lipase n=1 Tax=Notodromas monacha TaxID=399045 RepID=A0A7R9GKC4_9CRUS|nr:unnamed protein product [Notodromas monacha]CAG0924476.1 unnamed protein product [Notodromas monacha]
MIKDADEIQAMHLHKGPPESVPRLILDHGYPVETHDVTTADGYILEMHRIPHGIVPGSGPGEGSKTPILLAHGLMCSSAIWVFSGPKYALAYMLADAGFDVWLGNVRGNTYSARHTKLSTDETAFWEFGIDEHGYFDAPAQIDHITATTGAQKMFYVGYSMGATMFYIMSDMRPEYRERFIAMFALAPAAQMSHTTSIFKRIADYYDFIDGFLDLFGINRLLQNSFPVKLFNYIFCSHMTIDLCKYGLLMLTGFDIMDLNQEIDDEMAPVFFKHLPAGASRHSVMQFAASVISGKFTKYDYGSFDNEHVYGQEEAPEYKIEKSTTPALIYWAENDSHTAPEDVEWIKERLPNVVEFRKIDVDGFNHLDFVWSKKAKDALYTHMLDKALILDRRNKSAS